ncbi:MAG TPA: alanine racemase [Firmicutes bacterium]|nr:alanine racemase [Bacillota bacterium]
MPQTLATANSVVTVDLAKVKRNIERIRRHIGPEVAILYTAKSNGYGHGLIEPTLFMERECGIHHFATGMLCEAIQLREAGLRDFLLVLGGIPYDGVPEFVHWDLAATVYEDTIPKALSAEAVRQGKTVKVHLKIDTGLRRLGVRVGQPLTDLVNLVRSLPNLEIHGVYTHLANGYSLDKSFTHQQMGEFEQALAQLREMGIRPPLIHAANTAATVASPETYYDMVRLAALIFGYDISPGIPNRLGLEPSMEWSSFVTNVLWAEEGENVSYYRFFVPKRRTRVAILGFGMGDGYVRNLVTQDTAHNADVLIHGRRARLLDLNVDQAFADVTDIPDVKIGDRVILVGRDGDEEITTMELGERGGTSNGHVCCSITSRPFRHYING